MSIQARRERERAERERLIITAARELAESEGWDAVTTRRLATEIEYSQPVLYSHFKGKDAIMAAVAAEGFADLAARLRQARTSATDPRQALADVGAAYAAFAEQRPALYDAMFTHAVDLPFASPKHRSPCKRPSASYARPYGRWRETTTWRPHRDVLERAARAPHPHAQRPAPARGPRTAPGAAAQPFLALTMR